MKHLIYKKLEDGSYAEKMSSYEGPKDDTSANRSYLQAEPQASHFELPEGLDEDCVDLVWKEEVEAVQAVEAQPEMWVKEGEETLLEDPSDETYTHIPAVEAVEGVEHVPAHWELQENAAKVLAKRQAKAQANLDAIRVIRNAALDAVDKKINTIEDDGGDASAWKVHRKALRDCTDSLKKVDGSAKLSCENLVAEEFVLPSQPQ